MGNNIPFHPKLAPLGDAVVEDEGEGGEEGAGDGPHGDDDLGLEAGEEGGEVEGGAGEGLVGLGVAVGGLGAEHGVDDADVGAEEGGTGQVLVVEFLTGLADKGDAIFVFGGGGAFAYEEDAAGGGAVVGDGGAAFGTGAP